MNMPELNASAPRASGVPSSIPPQLSAQRGGDAVDKAAYTVAQIAAQFAEAVDRDARFPTEAIEAMREQRLLGAMIPRELGGLGATLADITSACRIIGQSCSSAGMVFAMHQIQVACIVEHAQGGTWHNVFIEQLVERQWLLASATSEDEVGGNLRRSKCAIEAQDGRLKLHKLTPTISYGAHADAILATARRDPAAAAAEQVLVTLLKSDATLTRRSSWDTFGMRGTCSEGFVLEAQGQLEQIFPLPFAQIAEQTMVPVSHILWAALWAGIANDAFQRANRYLRSQAQSNANGNAPAGRRIAEALALMQAIDGRIACALRLQAEPRGERSWSASMADAAEINTLKTFVSTTCLQIVHHAMMICGMAAYKNGTPFTLSRHLRDLYSAPLMINNDRIDANTANLMLAQRPVS
ncbi:acyl-CoA/acyl-ACP dehydrogenase [Paraburkholderia sp. MMS20-SJTR3]|uniref:Acyl-CoA/acyl-ACP dehydrogenase n=1 Tax=Paraburkholderia sejongensis TaxID=2886946 RepID=A0ABS8K3U5_9BURK|nr:acyl-CoA dehydrogenase family protein [Paraburkholderia sp. MMS20-SJTR3]MCC8396821.1 acyl-CoA/acyl-ACP dehydrogenase [Paraburkholderia sp. MMS20-SJTR3]